VRASQYRISYLDSKLVHRYTFRMMLILIAGRCSRPRARPLRTLNSSSSRSPYPSCLRRADCLLTIPKSLSTRTIKWLGKELLDLKDQPDLKDHPDQKVHRDLREILVLLVHKGFRVRKVHKDRQGRMVLRACQVHRGFRDRQALMALRDRQDRRAIRVWMVFKVPLAVPYLLQPGSIKRLPNLHHKRVPFVLVWTMIRLTSVSTMTQASIAQMS
jgi:hypothetical protein